MTKCAVDCCASDAHSSGLCKPHYDAKRRTGDPNTYRGDRSGLSLWEKIQEIGWTRAANGCLEYNGYRNELGYGQFRHDGHLARVHRVAYENLVEPLSRNKVVLHLCDNPSCSEPSHLRSGTQADNIADMHAKGRDHTASWTHCPNGHEYPPDSPPSSTKNRCRECSRERNRKYQQRKKENAHVMAAS